MPKHYARKDTLYFLDPCLELLIEALESHQLVGDALAQRANGCVLHIPNNKQTHVVVVPVLHTAKYKKACCSPIPTPYHKNASTDSTQ